VKGEGVRAYGFSAGVLGLRVYPTRPTDGAQKGALSAPVLDSGS
jgi:hypothetical protein